MLGHEKILTNGNRIDSMKIHFLLQFPPCRFLFLFEYFIQTVDFNDFESAFSLKWMYNVYFLCSSFYWLGIEKKKKTKLWNAMPKQIICAHEMQKKKVMKLSKKEDDEENKPDRCHVDSPYTHCSLSHTQ